jgi:hypothetical protein
MPELSQAPLSYLLNFVQDTTIPKKMQACPFSISLLPPIIAELDTSGEIN